MNGSRVDDSGHGWTFRIVVTLVLFAVYVFSIGPLGLMIERFGWNNSPVHQILTFLYLPLVHLAHLTGAIGWLTAYMSWWIELGFG